MACPSGPVAGVLVSAAPRGVDYDVVHINTEFAEQASDHDPQVVRFRPSAGNPALDALYDLLDWLDRSAPTGQGAD